jgi:hypothetical protein
MKRTLAALGLMTLTISSAMADDSNEIRVGSFLVLTSKDPFSGKDTVVAITGSEGSSVGFRCIQSKLSVVVATNHIQFTDGDRPTIKLRADNKDILEETGALLSNTMIEIDEDNDKIMNQVVGANSLAVRIMANTIFTFTVQLKQSDKVIGMVKAACAVGK